MQDKLTSPPQVNLSIQTQLAKLLAKENIRVIIGDYETAFFSVEERVLGLPAWNTNSKSLSDLLIGHEVGHALYTPKNWNANSDQIPTNVVNIVEDIRIERMILESFPGLIGAFRDGYHHLFDKNFFGIQGKDLNDLGFLDRLNIKGKGRELVDVPFTDQENDIYAKCLQAETFEEVLDICKEIVDYFKINPDKNQQQDDSSLDSNQDDESFDGPSHGTPSQDSPSDSNKNSQSDTSPADQDAQDDQDGPDAQSNQNAKTKKENNSNSPHKGDMDCDTLDKLNSNLQDLRADYKGYVKVELPTKEQIAKTVISIKETREARKFHGHLYSTLMGSASHHANWIKFKNEIKRNAQVLAKEFERRKAAHQYAKARESRTGKLDLNKLVRYKFDDQIFKSTMVLANSKSHGMLMFVDFSASMMGAMDKVIEQTLQKCVFCKLVNIPFRVFGFTSGIRRTNREDYESNFYNQIDLGELKLFELLNSNMNKSDYELACKELYLSHCGHGEPNKFFSSIEEMSGTPLFQTIIVSKTIINEFKKQNNLEKVNVVFITDGDSGAIRVNDPKSTWNKKLFSEWGGKMQELYDYRMSNYNHLYSNLVNGLKKETGASVICFYIPTGGSKYYKSAIAGAITTSKAYKILSNDENLNWWKAFEIIKQSKLLKKLTKDNMIFIEDGYGYDAYFVFKSAKDVELDDSEFSLDSDTTYDTSKAADRNKIAREYSKFQTKKRSSRSFLNKFSEMIA